MVINPSNARYHTPSSTALSPRTLIHRFLLFLLLSSLVASLLSPWILPPASNDLFSRLPSSLLPSASSAASPFYLGDKRNFLNQVFVKRAWGWNTLIWAVFISVEWLFGTKGVHGGADEAGGKFVRHVRRYTLATLCWWYLTQATWFFGIGGVGPSISHYILRRSGAVCVPREEGGICTGERGEYYRGGHDISGHSFILILSCMFLFETALPALLRLWRGKEKKGLVRNVPTYALLALMGIWYAMLLSTNLFFHTSEEKLSGAVAGVVGWWFMGL